MDCLCVFWWIASEGVGVLPLRVLVDCLCVLVDCVCVF